MERLQDCHRLVLDLLGTGAVSAPSPILVVDDDEDCLLSLHEALEAEDYPVFAARNGMSSRTAGGRSIDIDCSTWDFAAR